jgi:hypothetical protein
MRKVLCVLGALAIAVTIVAAQGVPDSSGKPCTGKIEKKDYCPKCDKILDAKDVKAGKCSKDEEKVVKVDVCMKKSYSFSCHPAKEAKAGGS